MGKIRTREHIIADLSVNHIEYYAIRCGFSVERIASDYGYDIQKGGASCLAMSE